MSLIRGAVDGTSEPEEEQTRSLGFNLSSSACAITFCFR